MTPDEVIAQLKKMGVEMSRPTLTRYEQQGLIPEPERGAYGRGGGRWTDYPDETVEEAYAAWSLIHGEYGYGDDELRAVFDGRPPKITPETIRIIRQLDAKSEGTYFDHKRLIQKQTPYLEEYSSKIVSNLVITLGWIWFEEKRHAEYLRSKMPD